MNPLVTPAWLVDRLSDPSVVVLDATLPPVGANPPMDTRTNYLTSHIPGAVYFDIEAISDPSTALPHMLPEPFAFSRGMSELGIDNSMTIVVYEQAGVYSAPRAWWTLRTFGAERVYILDGGLRAWRHAGLATEAGEVSRPKAAFVATLNRTAVKSFPEMRQLIQKHAQILDARSTGRFNGSAPEPRAGIPSGHMPAAINLPFLELVDENHLKPVDELRRVFAIKGVNLDEPITTTCGSGLTAAVLNLGLEIAGAKDVSLYDGSWTEYAQQPEAVIVKSPL